MISTIRAVCLACFLALAMVPAMVGIAQVPSAPAPAPSAKSVFAEDGPVDTAWGAQVIAVEDSASLKSSIEGMLKRRRIPYEIRSTSATEICYEVKLPLKAHTDTITEALKSVSLDGTFDVKWEQKKDTK